MSREFSLLVEGKEESDEDEDDAILHFMFSWEVRKKKIRSFLIWNTINVIVLTYLSYLIATYGDRSDHCISELIFFLLGYLVIHVCHLLKRCILIGIWLKAKDPTYYEFLMNLTFFFFVFLPEVGWYIYGNTFLYSKQIKECRKASNEAWILWAFSLKIVIFGYIVIALALGTLIFLIGTYFVFRSWALDEQ